MPEMTGTQFLRQAIALYPDARRVLLTAYADTDAAIAAINEINLDHYLLKPWEPPSERLYPVLDDLLFDWVARAQAPYEGIRIVGTTLSPACFQVREFLSSNQVPYQWIDIDTDSTASELVAAAAADVTRLPIVLLSDGSALVQPSVRELAAKIGLQTQAHKPFYDVVVVGGGPAGLAGAVYATSEGLRTVLVERTAPGGQAGTSSRIENYLGFPNGLSGADLARRAVTQAKRFGTEILSAQEVVAIERNDPYRTVKLADGSELSCYAVLLAPGMEVRRLDVPGAAELTGRGIYYGAAPREAMMYRGGRVFVVGGANSAAQGALYFSRFAEKVTMIVRGAGLHDMSQYLAVRIADTPHVECLTSTRVEGARGTERLEALTLANVESGETREVRADAMFVFIGATPCTEVAAGLVERDPGGFVLTGRDTMVDGKRPTDWTAKRDPFPFETSVPGIFAAGDARHGSGKRVALAVGEGSATIAMVHSYLETV